MTCDIIQNIFSIYEHVYPENIGVRIKILFTICSSYPEDNIVYLFRIHFKILKCLYFNHNQELITKIFEIFVRCRFQYATYIKSKSIGNGFLICSQYFGQL